MPRKFMGNKLIKLIVAALMLSGLVSCAVPQVSAEDRLFLDLQVEVLDRFELPQQIFQETTIGGLSALAYDPSQGELYALSDDRGRYGPPRYYRLDLTLGDNSTIEAVSVKSVTPLTQKDGSPFAIGQLDPEGIALSPRNTVIISSEGDASRVDSFLGEFDREGGQLVTQFRLPARYLNANPEGNEPPNQGVQNNLSLESLTISSGPAQSPGELFRLFTATESALIQDYNDDPSQPLNSRFLHYLLGQNQSTLIAEHRYPLDLETTGTLVNGLSELLLLDRGGHFLALERAFGLKGFQVKLYQLATGGATDTSSIDSLRGNLEGITPIRKRLLLDFANLDIDLGNLEGMTLGPPLDGDQSLILVSDNNFEMDQPSQFWLLRLKGL